LFPRHFYLFLVVTTKYKIGCCGDTLFLKYMSRFKIYSEFLVIPSS